MSFVEKVVGAADEAADAGAAGVPNTFTSASDRKLAPVNCIRTYRPVRPMETNVLGVGMLVSW